MIVKLLRLEVTKEFVIKIKVYHGYYLEASPCHLPNDSFSPESGGRVNPNNAIEAISTHGTIKLKK